MNISTPDKQKLIIDSIQGGASLRDICRKAEVAKGTVVRYKQLLDLDKKENKQTVAANTVDIDHPTLCACGCGEQINPLYDQIRVLREQRMTFAVIGKELGIDKKYAQLLHRKPPKFVKGHVGKTIKWVKVKCRACGHEFSTSDKSGREYCVNRNCGAGDLFGPRHKQFIKRLDNKIKEDRKSYKKIVIAEKKLWTLEDDRIEKAKQREHRATQRRHERELKEIALLETRKQNKIARAAQRQHERWQRQARQEMQRAVRTGKPLSWHIQDHSNKLLTAEQRHELDELLYEQNIEMKRGNYGWGERPKGSTSAGYTRSLDVPLGDDTFSTMGDLLTSRMDFTSNNYIENLMKNNGTHNNGRLIVTHGKR